MKRQRITGKAGRRAAVKRLVDVLLTLLLLCLMAYQATGEKLHEWFGIGMCGALILHHVLNTRWYAALFRGKYSSFRSALTAVNILLMGSILLTAVCGMSMSAYAVPFLYGLLPLTLAQRFHLSMSYWSFVLMGLHLGMHLPAMTAGLQWSRKCKTAAASVLSVISGIGLWRFAENRIPDYLLFRTPFAFFDYGKSGTVVFAENLVTLIFFSFLGACAALLLQGSPEKDPANRSNTECRVLAALLGSVLTGALLLLA